MKNINERFKGLEPKFKLKWDYLGYKKKLYPLSKSIQTDWNQTLITIINQLSTQIHMATCTIDNPDGVGPADTIIMNWNHFDLVNDLAFFKIKKGMIGSRYAIVIDNDISDDCIYVFKKNIPEDYDKEEMTIGIITLENY